MPSFEHPYYGTVHYTHQQWFRLKFKSRIYYPARMWVWEHVLRYLPGGRCPSCHEYKQFRHKGECALCELFRDIEVKKT